MASVPLQFTANAVGTTLTVTVASAASYGTNVTNFDADLGYLTATATFVSSTQASGYTVFANQASPGVVSISGIASDQLTVGQPAGSALVTLTFTLKTKPADFPVTLANVLLNNDAALTGTADPAILCFVRGTLIRTDTGNVPVETLQPGDIVATIDGIPGTVQWVGRRRVACAQHGAPHDVMPVRVRENAMGDGLPARDLLMSPDHAVFIDGGLIPIRYLLNGATIVQETWSEVTYFHVELERHAVLFAEGLPAESYLDSGNRGAFDDHGTTVIALKSRAMAVWQEHGFAPLVYDGAPLEHARRRLLDNAALLGHQLTPDPGLCLNVDGTLIRGRRAGQDYSFAVPPHARSVRLQSRCFLPGHVVPSSTDMRRLGVAVTKLLVDGAAHQPGAAQGWHPAEDGLQWTDGDAEILGATTRVQVTLSPLGRYWAADTIRPSQLTRAA